jgi:hypothetical protein
VLPAVSRGVAGRDVELGITLGFTEPNKKGLNKLKDVNEASVESVVMRLPSRVVQIQVVSIPESANNGDYTELIALCEDGSLWTQYHSNGYANVPNDNRWYQLHPEHESGQPTDQYRVSPLD